MAVLAVVGAALTGGGLLIDWLISRSIDGSVSQLEQLILNIEAGATLQDFLTECWLPILFGAVTVFAALDYAFPKRRRMHG